MTEPTSGDQKPDPDRDHDETQDQTSEPVFNDPTAPVWADPTAPMPAPPAPPGAAPPQVESPAAAPPSAPPVSNPYAQQPPAQPYGQPTGQYGQPQQPAYSQQYPAYGQQSYATGSPTEANTSGIVLTIVSGIVMLSTCFTIGIPSLVFGIMALTSNNADPVGSRKKAKTGWILFAVNAGVIALIVVVGFALLIATNSSINDDFGY
jgi:hypothetical protein